MGAADIPEVAAIGFDRAAAEYERARPEYPQVAIDDLAAALGIGAGSTVVDLAAGTGKFTRGLVRTGAKVVAAEPVEGMRAQLRIVCPGVEVVDGTAESLPFGDASVDAVTVAQAFHWFDRPAALAELGRVIRPGGGLAAVWNRRDESVAWQAGMTEVIEWHQRQIADYKRVDWCEELTSTGHFGSAERREYPWVQPMTRARLADRVRSISYIGASPAEEQQALVDKVLALVEDQPDEFPMPYVTDVFWCRRRS